jgi:16S rRNA (adenine(1408)-N(1))-methyltransferase
LIARHERVSMDFGTGDGRAVLVAAARDPVTLVLGLDANASAMAEASRRAARALQKGGLPNARFILASAESPPPVLAGAADLVTVRLPWGSLLRGVVGADAAVAAGIAGVVAPHGSLELLLAPAARDGLDGMPTSNDDLVAGVATAFHARGFDIEDVRTATPAEVKASGSTWARRLDRPSTLIRLVRR